MPIYRFRCPQCLEEEEALVPMANRNDSRFHSCGAVMQRLISAPCLTIIKVYGRDSVLDTLNGEDRYARKDGRPVRSNRSQMALARGLDQTRPVIGKGF